MLSFDDFNDNLKAVEREQEEKGITNPAPFPVLVCRPTRRRSQKGDPTKSTHCKTNNLVKMSL